MDSSNDNSDEDEKAAAWLKAQLLDLGPWGQVYTMLEQAESMSSLKAYIKLKIGAPQLAAVKTLQQRVTLRETLADVIIDKAIDSYLEKSEVPQKIDDSFLTALRREIDSAIEASEYLGNNHGRS